MTAECKQRGSVYSVIILTKYGHDHIWLKTLHGILHPFVYNLLLDLGAVIHSKQLVCVFHGSTGTVLCGCQGSASLGNVTNDTFSLKYIFLKDMSNVWCLYLLFTFFITE